MTDDFDAFVLKKEALHWVKELNGSYSCGTTRGNYWITAGVSLTFMPLHGVAQYLGRFKDPKRAARRHFDNVA